MIDETSIVTYKSENAARSDLIWLAQVALPNGKYWGVYFTGSTESEAVAKAVSFWNSESQKAAKINSEAQPFVKSAPASLPSSWTDLASDVKSDGRGYPTKGMVWLINKTTRAKCRVSPEVATDMLISGIWERGGPRSK